MNPVQHFAVRLQPRPGLHTMPMAVVVHSGATVVDGLPVYQDSSGHTRVVIGADHIAHLIAQDGTAGGEGLTARPLP